LSKKIHILFFLFALGLFLLPSSSYACGNTTAKTSCEKKVTSKEKKTTSDQNCCSSNHNGDHTHQHGCNGKCDPSGCTTSTLHFSLLSANEFEFQNNAFNFSVENPIPYYKNLSISDGYTSIWLPPKIK
jgi:hypothetical protein